MATVTDYTGNAGLGFGGNNIDFNAGNLSGVNQAYRDVLLSDIDQNNRIFQQRVRDRDNLYQLLATNQVQSGRISDKDRKVFDEAQNRQQQAFDAIQGANDTKGIEAYYRATNDLRNVTTQAQARYLNLAQLQEEAAKQQLPSEQKAWQSHIQNQESKPFWNTIDPYQQTLKNDFNGMRGIISQNGLIGGGGALSPNTQTRDTTTTTTRNGKTTVTNTQTTSPVSARGASSVSRGTVNITPGGGLSPITTTSEYYDYPVFRRNAMEASVGDEAQRIYQQRWRETFENLDPNTLSTNIDLINKRLREYNAERGLTPNDEGYVSDIQVAVDPQSGRIQIAETSPDFAAKTTLASIDGPYSRTSSSFNKDIGQYLQGEQQLALDWYKAKTARQRGDIYAKWMDFKMKDQTPSSQKLLQNWTSIIDKITPQGIEISSNGIKKGSVDVVWADQLPEGFRSVAGVAQDRKGRVVSKVLEPKVLRKGGRPYYDVFYFDLNGNKIDTNNKNLVDAYNMAKNNQDPFRGTLYDFLKLQAQQGNIQLEIEGKNGRANAISAIESQRALNAAATAKGEENIFAQMADDLTD